jgi:hypothetical protein
MEIHHFGVSDIDVAHLRIALSELREMHVIPPSVQTPQQRHELELRSTRDEVIH